LLTFTVKVNQGLHGNLRNR